MIYDTREEAQAAAKADYGKVEVCGGKYVVMPITVNTKVVAKMFDVTTRTIWTWEKEGHIPKRLTVSNRSATWHLKDIIGLL